MRTWNWIYVFVVWCLNIHVLCYLCVCVRALIHKYAHVHVSLLHTFGMCLLTFGVWIHVRSLFMSCLPMHVFKPVLVDCEPFTTESNTKVLWRKCSCKFVWFHMLPCPLCVQNFFFWESTHFDHATTVSYGVLSCYYHTMYHLTWFFLLYEKQHLCQPPQK